MSQRFLRHNIVGSEVSRPRPIAYLRAGWPRRRRGAGRQGRPAWIVAGLLLLIAALLQLAG